MDMRLRSAAEMELRGELLGSIWYWRGGKSAEPKELRGVDRVSWKGMDGRRSEESSIVGTPERRSWSKGIASKS